MFTRIFIYFLLTKFSTAQLNGEFWWLSDKFAAYAGERPPPPKFEKLKETDHDESEKIIFRDDNLLTNSFEPKEGGSSILPEETTEHELAASNIIRWPDDEKVFYGVVVQNNKPQPHSTVDTLDSKETGDRFTFKFLKDGDDFLRKEQVNNTTEKPSPALEPEGKPISISSTVLYNDKVSFKIHFEDQLSESICTFLTKSDCVEKKGILNIDQKDQKKYNCNHKLICCILPLKVKNESSNTKLYFPDNIRKNKRLRRSEDLTQRQRHILLQRKYAHQGVKTRPVLQTKITTPDYEYDDPYWNIKNLKNPNKQNHESNTKYDYSTDEYSDDYIVELPRPGLIGLYSDNDKRPPGWFPTRDKGSAYGGTDDYEDDDDGFGYSTIDPRIDTTRKSRPRIKPFKLTSASDESAYDAESHTVSYHSNPDFNVLHDFKLPNIFRNKNKGSKVTRSTTTESISDQDSKETLLTGSLEGSDDFASGQIFKDCGKIAKATVYKSKGKQIGDTENGSHPWLALLVPTQKLNNILCYATLIHPRAAITAADCVHRSSPGDITLIAGLWNLNERSRWKTRVITARLHPKYKSGGLNNNLAILHWKRPLKLGVNTQPVCLANPHLNDECIFVGWSGFDQALRPRSRWQRATVHTCDDRPSLNGVQLPDEAFCASVKTRGTVTGIGGSLVCNVNGHPSAVGVAVSRDSTLVLLPIYEWVTEAIGILED